jgi:hypothetical protein
MIMNREGAIYMIGQGVTAFRTPFKQPRVAEKRLLLDHARGLKRPTTKERQDGAENLGGCLNAIPAVPSRAVTGQPKGWV